MRKFLISLGAIVAFTIAAAFIYQTQVYNPPKRKNKALEDYVHTDVPGWTSKEQQIASSEEMLNTVKGTLNYDDVFYRSYRRGNNEITLYIAYWEPQKMPVRLVQAHTPDICWVRSGWNVADSEYAVNLTANNQSLKPAEFRIMEKDMAQQYVYYWHVVGDTVYTSRTIGVWSRWDPIKSFFRFGFNQQQEQFFIRLASNQAFEGIFEDPGFQAILNDLAKMTLQESSPL